MYSKGSFFKELDEINGYVKHIKLLGRVACPFCILSCSVGQGQRIMSLRAA
jgi:hypothetical protein